MNSSPSYLEIEVSGTEPTWCVDGRPDYTKQKGPQMLGAILHPILLAAVEKNIPFNKEFVCTAVHNLQDAGYTPGVHRGSHKHPELGSCDCGFADKMLTIIQTALQQREEITKRLNVIYNDHEKTIGKFDKTFAEIIADAYDRLAHYSTTNLALTGEELLHTVEDEGATVEDVQGDHGEEVAFVNLKKNTTFDTNKANQEGRQAFNLDLWAVIEEAEKISVSPLFALGASLILYIATEMVLVENKGKPPLPVVLHA